MLQVRRVVSQQSVTFLENGRALTAEHRSAIVGAVIRNPYPGEFVEDLVTVADEIGAELGSVIVPRLLATLDDEVEAFGKAALVGMAGEVEHGSALIHNLRFGNVFREAVSGTELLPAAEKCGPAGCLIDIPLKHKLDAKTRSHHQTVTFAVSDAPRPDEIIVILAAANSGRPLARLAPFGAEVGATV